MNRSHEAEISQREAGAASWYFDGRSRPLGSARVRYLSSSSLSLLLSPPGRGNKGGGAPRCAQSALRAHQTKS